MISDAMKLVNNDIKCIRTVSKKLYSHFNVSDVLAIKDDLKEIERCTKEISELIKGNHEPLFMTTDQYLKLREHLKTVGVIEFRGEIPWH